MSQSLAEELGALAEDIRPDLHRYCARLTGSVLDGDTVFFVSTGTVREDLNALAAAAAETLHRAIVRAVQRG